MFKRGEIMVWTIKQKKVYRQLMNLTNLELSTLIHSDLKIKIKFNDSNFNEEEKDFICVAIFTDYNPKQIETAITKLKNSSKIKPDWRDRIKKIYLQFK